MATSFFGKFTPSRTQCNQRPKINIQNMREYIGPSTMNAYAWDVEAQERLKAHRQITDVIINKVSLFF